MRLAVGVRRRCANYRKSATLIAEVKRQLKYCFEMTDIVKCSFIFGIEVNDNEDGIVLTKSSAYIHDILRRFGMQNCKPAANPVDLSVILVPSDVLLS